MERENHFPHRERMHASRLPQAAWVNPTRNPNPALTPKKTRAEAGARRSRRFDVLICRLLRIERIGFSAEVAGCKLPECSMR